MYTRSFVGFGDFVLLLLFGNIMTQWKFCATIAHQLPQILLTVVSRQSPPPQSKKEEIVKTCEGSRILDATWDRVSCNFQELKVLLRTCGSASDSEMTTLELGAGAGSRKHGRGANSLGWHSVWSARRLNVCAWVGDSVCWVQVAALRRDGYGDVARGAGASHTRLTQAWSHTPLLPGQVPLSHHRATAPAATTP